MEFLLSRRGAGSRAAILAGDNRLVTDHGRFRRRLGDAALQGAFTSNQARLEGCGWTIEWFLFPRAANATVDRLAKAVRAGTRPASHAWCGGAPAEH